MSASMSAAASSASTSSSAAAPSSVHLSDSELLSSLGLSEADSAAMLASADDLIATYGADTTVEEFLTQQGEKHVAALQSYYDQRIQAMQTEANQQMAEIRANFAQ